MLEQTVIDSVLTHYAPYLTTGGRKKLVEAVKAQLGNEVEELDQAKQRVDEEQTLITGSINNLLDNLTETNREFVDERLQQLKKRQESLAQRAEELELLELSQSNINSTVDESIAFLAKLEFILKQGLPQEKLVALRQCIQRIHINQPEYKINITVHRVPATNLTATQTLEAKLIS